MNFAYKKLQEEEKKLREAQNLFEYNQINERNWVIKERSSVWKGWNPFDGAYMKEALEYEDVPDWDIIKHMIIKEEKSEAVNVIASMRNLIEFGEKWGMVIKHTNRCF